MKKLSILILSLAFLMTLNVLSTLPRAKASPLGQWFDNVVFVIMENHSRSSLIHAADCPGINCPAPYLYQLATTYAQSTNYATDLHGSLPNYLKLLAGYPYSSWSGCDKAPYDCPNVGYITPTLVDRLNYYGISWKAYLESYPGNGFGPNYSSTGCFMHDSSPYAGNHNPFIFTNSVSRASGGDCNKVVDSGTSAANLVSDLGTPSTAPQFAWLTPNQNHNMHDGSVASGDSYLNTVVTNILATNTFQQKRAAVVITFDESCVALNPGCGLTSDSANAPLYFAVAGSAAKTAYSSSTSYNHYSWLNTIINNWSMACMYDECGLATMSEFFKGTTTLTEGPACCDTPTWYIDSPHSNNAWIYTQDSHGPSCKRPVGFEGGGNNNGCGDYSSVDTCNPHCINYFAPWDSVRFHFEYWGSQNPLANGSNHATISIFFQLSGTVNGNYWNSGSFGTSSRLLPNNNEWDTIITLETTLSPYSSFYPPQAGSYTLGALIQITDSGPNPMTYYCSSGYGSLVGSPNYCAAEVVVTFHTA